MLWYIMVYLMVDANELERNYNGTISLPETVVRVGETRGKKRSYGWK